MASAGTHDSYQEFQQRLQIRFQREELLVLALTHRSCSVDDELSESNERLEFLGDSVLDLIMAEELYARHPDWPEGKLTKSKAFAVGERALERIARQWNLGAYVRVSHGEELSGGRERRSLLADAVEALIGAYYLDQGLLACRDLVLRAMQEILESIDRQEHEQDYKTQLQEVFQARYQEAPSYQVVSESGPPHQRTFTIAVTFAGDEFGRGEGHSKKEAEQLAAARALERLEVRS